MLIDTVLRKRYKIVELLGGGTSGNTYIAEDLDLPSHPKCVVKHLRFNRASQPEVLSFARRLFENEAKALDNLGKLSNQIPKLLDHFEEKGEFYLVQELVDGHELSVEITPGKPWGEAEVVKLLQEILEVLVVVHQHKIIHRDIKPQNLMRRHEDNKIVLIDFGAVKEIKELTANTQGSVTSTIIIGSKGYMPNEQANGKPKLCSDIYAAGMVGIQALTGKLPQEFPEDANGEIIWRDSANVSNKFADVLTKMVRCDFRQRYPSAAEALKALALVSPATPVSVNWWKLRFSRQVLVGVGVVPMLIIATLTWLTKTTPHPDDNDNFTQLPCDSKFSSDFLSPSPEKLPDKEFKNAKYYGSFDNDVNGKGILIFESNIYEGDFINGKLTGCGRILYSPRKGEKKYVSVGQFVNHKLNGLGKITWEDGVEYKGNFKDGKCEGLGIFKFADGASKKGDWHQGNLRESDLTCNR